MSGLVVDASVVIAWLFDDEKEPRADKVLENLKEDGALVPHLWHLETRNTLLVAERRRRLSARAVNERLDALKALPVRTDEGPDLESAFDLARTHNLSIYDALYLELAKREMARSWQPWTAALGQAAVAEGVPLSVT